MKVLGIIAEYNPFHNGHVWHIDRSKVLSGATHTLILMSGSVVQRGSFAVQNKWQRAEHAIEGGADLVCELPAICSGQRADIFALGAITILSATQTVDYLSFGSEAGRIDSLNPIAELLLKEPPAFRWKLSQYLKAGESFAHSRTLALSDLLGAEAATISEQPNNILALEYLKALSKINSSITPITFMRKGASHHEHNPVNNTVSASWIRHCLLNSDQPLTDCAPFIPYDCHEFETNQYPLLVTNYEKFIIARLATTDLSEIRRLPDVGEGLEFALKKSLEKATSLEEILQTVSSKRIPKSRIRRILMNLALNRHQNELIQLLEETKPYLRVLAFNRQGQELLAHIRDHSDIPILTNLRTNQTRLDRIQRCSLNLDIQANNFRSIMANQKCYNEDYRRNPVRTESINSKRKEDINDEF
ncbi:MAG: nucleotidyltransferase family protein [Eubacteriaceae bacterium]|nr:nucleotidyltransferase family protein [Eubacteriaceae bacterium]MDD4507907.1 nucleotidyltransferase family protein [Eubacteriaceae bacterium]